MNSDFLADGKHYDLLIDWEKRISPEINFISEIANRNSPKIHSILEIGCGTGRHTERLQNRYCVTGIDINPSMIEEAKTRASKAELVSGDLMDLNILRNRSFDAIISLGNTVGLIATSYVYELIIYRIHSLLKRPNGLLIFQILNMEKERNGWSTPRSVRTREGEYIFLREFRTTLEYIIPQILTLFRPNNEKSWAFSSMGPTTIPRITRQGMFNILKKAGFGQIEFYGSYRSEEFDPQRSTDMIAVAHT
ncbi:MAG: class I SAM-dependent methyltransferase [Candidatus Heimdallarchaeota archaeon]